MKKQPNEYNTAAHRHLSFRKRVFGKRSHEPAKRPREPEVNRQQWQNGKPKSTVHSPHALDHNQLGANDNQVAANNKIASGNQVAANNQIASGNKQNGIANGNKFDMLGVHLDGKHVKSVDKSKHYRIYNNNYYNGQDHSVRDSRIYEHSLDLDRQVGSLSGASDKQMKGMADMEDRLRNIENEMSVHGYRISAVESQVSAANDRASEAESKASSIASQSDWKDSEIGSLKAENARKDRRIRSLEAENSFQHTQANPGTYSEKAPGGSQGVPGSLNQVGKHTYRYTPYGTFEDGASPADDSPDFAAGDDPNQPLPHKVNPLSSDNEIGKGAANPLPKSQENGPRKSDDHGLQMG